MLHGRSIGDAMKILQSSFNPRTSGILQLCKQYVKDGNETLLKAAERLLINDALADCSGIQKDAAKLLGMTQREMNYRAGKYRLRPKDRRVALR